MPRPPKLDWQDPRQAGHLRARLIRNIAHDDRRAAFRTRQRDLALAFAVMFALHAWTALDAILPLAALLAIAGATEAHRFRKTGRTYLTRARTIGGGR